MATKNVTPKRASTKNRRTLQRPPVVGARHFVQVLCNAANESQSLRWKTMPRKYELHQAIDVVEDFIHAECPARVLDAEGLVVDAEVTTMMYTLGQDILRWESERQERSKQWLAIDFSRAMSQRMTVAFTQLISVGALIVNGRSHLMVDTAAMQAMFDRYRRQQGVS